LILQANCATASREGSLNKPGLVYDNAQRLSGPKGIMAATCAVDCVAAPTERKATMLYTIAVVLLVLWLLGLVTSTTMGGLIHVLLVIAVIVVLVRLLSGRSAV
jgi:uncharacterized membrane protein YtjA (UPF0391 family)